MFNVNVLTPDRVPDFFIPPKWSRPATWKRAALEQRLWECQLTAPGDGGLLDGHHDGDSTDWDPHSRAALSLPHLPRADTPYGFCRLLESPHTRRKESLFHDHSEQQGIAFPCPGRELVSAPWPSGQRPVRALGWREVLGSSREGGSLSSSPGSSPEHSGRGSQGVPFALGVVPLGQSLTKESSASLGDRGILRLRAEFCSQRQRVWIRLLSVEGLYEQVTDCQTINCCLSLCLKPGKEQKQRTAGIRRSRNPIFNQDFFFFGISGDQLNSRFCLIKVFNKVSRIKRKSVLGVCQLSLASILPL
ncbi:C2 calcium-dependent domain-containing protein 4C-like [Mustelus asterias]